jgi:hypothetical protein
MATKSKGKGSKNNKGSKVVMELPKRIKPKKSEVLVEITKEVFEELYGSQSQETGVVSEFRGKKIIKTTQKFGKKYIVLLNQ